MVDMVDKVYQPEPQLRDHNAGSCSLSNSVRGTESH